MNKSPKFNRYPTFVSSKPAASSVVPFTATGRGKAYERSYVKRSIIDELEDDAGHSSLWHDLRDTTKGAE